MTGICLVAAGIVVAALPADEFTLAWQHSVAKTRWEERYRVDGDRLALVEARVEGTGAGMEPAPGARFGDGHWSWQPRIAPLTELRLTQSEYTRDYDLCWKDRCAPLATLAGSPEATVIVVRACAAANAP